MVSDNQVGEEVQKMSDKPEGLIRSILDSYKKDDKNVFCIRRKRDYIPQTER